MGELIRNDLSDCDLDLSVVRVSDQGLTPTDLQVFIDDCGRFAVEFPGGTIQVLVEGDGFASTLTSIFTGSGGRFGGLTIYVTRDETIASWTAEVGEPFGARSLAEAGLYVAQFSDVLASPAGIALAGENGSFPDADFYFDDPGTDLQLPSAALDTTGPNGVGLLVETPLQEVSGVGGELDARCEWRPAVGGGVPGYVWVQDHPAQLTGEPNTPCPIF